MLEIGSASGIKAWTLWQVRRTNLMQGAGAMNLQSVAAGPYREFCFHQVGEEETSVQQADERL